MADPFKPVRPGQDLSISATGWNAAMDAARAEQNRQHNQTFDQQSQSRQGEIIRVLNSTGSDLSRHSVVGLDAPIFLPSQSIDAFLREVAFRAVVPTTTHTHKFAVLLEPAASGQVARAYVAGVCQAKVNVTNTAHIRADIEAGVTGRLVSGDTGAAQILWKELGTTGEQWTVCRLDVPCCGEPGPGVEPCSPCDLPKIDLLMHVTSNNFTSECWNVNEFDVALTYYPMPLRDPTDCASPSAIILEDVHWQGAACITDFLGDRYDALSFLFGCKDGILYLVVDGGSGGGRTAEEGGSCGNCGRWGIDGTTAEELGNTYYLQFDGYACGSGNNLSNLTINSCSPLDIIVSGFTIGGVQLTCTITEP